jgi:hypothetical protein
MTWAGDWAFITAHVQRRQEVLSPRRKILKGAANESLAKVAEEVVVAHLRLRRDEPTSGFGELLLHLQSGKALRMLSTFHRGEHSFNFCESG